MAIIKFASRVVEKTPTGIMTTIAWTGSKDDMLAKSAENPAGSVTGDGVLRNSRVFQESPNIWCCELKYAADEHGEAKGAAETIYGRKSAQLKGSMLSLPLECHVNYLTCWNHYLAGAPGARTVPSWWETAKDAVLSESDSQKYAWIKSPGEIPEDRNGRWRILKDPLKPGTDTYDLAVYSVTETARFRTPRAAGRMVVNTLNRIGEPNETFGIKGGDWKCDDASVSYDGEDWFATLTWTLSGDDKGWDKDLYLENPKAAGRTQ